MKIVIINEFIREFICFFYMFKYGTIWNIKKELLQSKSKMLLIAYETYLHRFGSWIGAEAVFKSEPCFPHGPFGIFISGGAKIGSNVVIFQQVTIGSNTLNDSLLTGSPVIGDNVYIGSGAKIIGNINIGDNCRIGANAVVYQDLAPHSVAVQSPTRIVQKSNLDNRYYTKRDGKWVYFNEGRWINDNDKNNSFVC